MSRLLVGFVLIAIPLVLGTATNAPASHSWLHKCDDWGSWVETSKECKQGMFCFGSNQRKTVIHLERSRQCRNGIQKQSKSRSVCGC